MGPVKYDDIPKTAKEILSDDYQPAGYQFKAKQKTSFKGAIVTTTADFVPTDSCKAKVSWKIPDVLGNKVVSIDKLDMTNKGLFACEAAASNFGVNGLKLEKKSDLKNPKSVALGATFTGVKDLHVKVETKPLKLEDFTMFAVYGNDTFQAGLKCTGPGIPNVAARVNVPNQPVFASVAAEQNLSVFTGHVMCTPNPQLQLAGMASYNKKDNSTSFELGGAFKLADTTKIKAKANDKGVVNLSVKHDLTKGFTVLNTVSYNAKTAAPGFGVQLSVE